MLLPRSCPVCGRLGSAPCPDCADALERAPALPSPPGVDACRSIVAYEGPGRELVARLKYRNARSSLPWLAAAMAASIDPASIDVVTWVPTTAARRRQRGFDHAELLARAVARRLRVRCQPLLRRAPGPPQTGRTMLERRTGPRLTARARAPARVLVVDDVVTTGSTVTAAAKALRMAGAQRVLVVTAARTPPRIRRAASAPGARPEVGK